MRGLPVYLVVLLTPLAWGCSKESPSPDKTFDKERLCDSTVCEGRYCLTAKRLTILFDGIRIGDDGKDTRYHVVRLAPQQPGQSHTTTVAVGSTKVVHTQAASQGGASEIRINEYQLRLVEDGKAS